MNEQEARVTAMRGTLWDALEGGGRQQSVKCTYTVVAGLVSRLATLLFDGLTVVH